MNEGLIPRRYAKALYKVALEKGADKRLYGLMTALAESFSREKGLQEAIANPYIAASDKSLLLTTAAGATPDDTVYADFLKLLDRNRRTDMMADIARAYCRIYRTEHHIYVVNVVSAAPLPAAQLQRLQQMVKSHLPEGSTMEFTTSVDPSLIGGFTVSVGNERIDASISNELKQMRISLIRK